MIYDLSAELSRFCDQIGASQDVELARLGPTLEPQQIVYFKEKARGGSVLAQVVCAACCRHEWGGEAYEDAMGWAKLAANENFAPAFYELGVCFESGVGCEVNYDEALKHLETSASMNFCPAILHLSVGFHDGYFYKKDSVKALAYAERAFVLGDSNAACLLSSWYEDGEGTEKNIALAQYWLERAANMGNEIALARIGMAYMVGSLGYPVDMDKSNFFLKQLSTSD